MIGALWTGISGLASQQQALDNESNNIANVNTIGFKASRISFADQMYQDKIGKGSKVLDAEKIYEQGNLKLTGVSYDMALSGSGFFTLSDKSSTGTSETLYTRAGNFRMGDNGTLQDAAGNEVQGWMMTSIDTANDVTSTNPNVNVFTTDYTKLLSSKIVKHSTYIETITAKATDYSATATSDSETIFSGYGLKTKSAKIGDIEEAIKDYASWLQKLSEEPDGASATSTAQQSQINFKSGNDALLSKEGDQVYVVINGEKISQSYIPTTATAEQIAIFNDDPSTVGVDPIDDQNNSGGALTTEDYDLAASRIATYKALADKISEKSGLVAYMAKEGDASATNNDVLQLTESFTPSTELREMLKGILTIKSLIPGQEFSITEVGEESGVTKLEGSFQTNVAAAAGSGMGAVSSSRDALAKLVTGKQRDVYTESDLELTTTAANNDYRLSITIFDKDLGKSIPVPNDGAVVPQAVEIAIDDVSDIDDFITKFNAALDSGGAATTPPITDYIEAVNVNGSLVIRNLDSNFDVDFNTSLKHDGSNSGTFVPLDKNNDYSGREGASAEFIEIVNKVDQTATKGSLQLRLDTLGLSDSAFGEFAVDSSGVITMTQDGAEIAIGQVAIALFNNNRGLLPSGDNLLKATNDSGDPIFNLNNDKTANIEGKTLELSTADLSESLVNLMVFQRAFEANAKSITSSDSLLNTLINLKR